MIVPLLGIYLFGSVLRLSFSILLFSLWIEMLYLLEKSNCFPITQGSFKNSTGLHLKVGSRYYYLQLHLFKEISSDGSFHVPEGCQNYLLNWLFFFRNFFLTIDNIFLLHRWYFRLCLIFNPFVKNFWLTSATP